MNTNLHNKSKHLNNNQQMGLKQELNLGLSVLNTMLNWIKLPYVLKV